jgi:dihydrofolate reductase
MSLDRTVNSTVLSAVPAKAQVDWMTIFIDSVLLGDVTYREQARAWPSRQGRMAELLNKTVFASHDNVLSWNNSRRGRPSGHRNRPLKENLGKDIFLTGGARLARSPARDGLIDIYHLLVHPVVLGDGLSLFGDASLRLVRVSSCEFASGTVHLAYCPQIRIGETR